MTQSHDFPSIVECLMRLTNSETVAVLDNIEELLDELERQSFELKDFDLPAIDGHSGASRTRLKSFGDHLGAFKAIRQTLAKAALACGQPSDKLTKGQMLSRHEYYLFQSGLTGMVPAGNFPSLTKVLGRDYYDEYEVYCHLFYEDDNHSGYIYPDCYEKSVRHFSGAFLVRPVDHDEVRKASLRQGQADFWRLEFPEEFSRFRDC